jgi:voltage-gated potassium channel
MKRLGHIDVRRLIAWYTAPLMFFASLAFLVCQAILVVVWVDVPNLSENALVAIDPANPNAEAIRRSLSQPVVDQSLQEATVTVIFLLWPLIIVESIWHWISRPWDAANRRFHFFGLLFCLCPSLRMCARSPEMHGRLWLPNLKWRHANRRLRKRLERRFSVPMILIALLIMPVLLVEFFMQAQVAQYIWLRAFLHVGTGVIWFAFAFEFILMVSVAKKKIAYCKNHWIDLAIIILPLFSFLRTLQMFRATRIAHMVRLPMLTKLARVYRLRGTAVKALQGLLVLELFHRVGGTNPQRRIDKLQRQLNDIELEAEQIRRKIVKLERTVAENSEVHS